MILLISKLIFALSLLVPVTAWAELRGAALVHAEMPALYDACFQELGATKAEAFFADWELSEIAFLRTKFAKLLALTDATRPFVPTADRLSLSFQTHIFGCAGEAYGNARMRLALSEVPDSQFLDSHDYDRLNPHGTKPDGVLYRIENDRIIVLRILESKLGSSAWSASQIQGFIKQWSTKGLTVVDSEASRHFGPEAITIRTASGGIPVSSASVDTIRRIAVLVSTRDQPEFPGELARLPMSSSELRSVGLRYIAELRGSRSAAPGSHAEPAPQLEGQTLEDFRKTLEDFMVENRRWPNSTDGVVGEYLIKNIGRRGGQTKVFLNDIPGYFRHFLTLYGKLPAMSPLQHQISSLDPENPEAASILRAYIRKYETRVLGEPSPIHALLVARHPGWQEFFRRHPLESLRVADLVEVNLCLDVLLQAQATR